MANCSCERVSNQHARHIYTNHFRMGLKSQLTRSSCWCCFYKSPSMHVQGPIKGPIKPIVGAPLWCSACQLLVPTRFTDSFLFKDQQKMRKIQEKYIQAKSADKGSWKRVLQFNICLVQSKNTVFRQVFTSWTLHVSTISHLAGKQKIRQGNIVKSGVFRDPRP